MYNSVKKGSMVLGLLLPLTTQAQPYFDNKTSDLIRPSCDMSFINPPLFGSLCQNSTVTGTFTVQNNSPIALNINYIRIKNNDAFPDDDAVIVPAPVNNCGSALAPGANCEISVQLTSSTTLGSFNRVLQVGINSRQVEIDAPAITVSVANCTTPPPTPPAGFTPTIPGTPLYLYESSILGASTVTNTGPTVISGDLDLTPGSSVTGFPPGVIVNGVQNINNTAASNVKTAASNYFTALNGLPCDFTFGAGTDISTLSPIDCTASPVYCFTSSALINTGLVLNGGSGTSCTFLISSTLTVANNSTMTTSGGILNDNINWAIGSSATLGTNSTLIGIIDALASVTLNTGSTLNGRAWALNGAVTLDSNAVSPQG